MSRKFLTCRLGVLLVIVIAFFLTAGPVFADLSNLRDDVEEAESVSRNSEEYYEEDTEDDYYQDDECCCEDCEEESNIFVEIMVEILSVIWSYNNAAASYSNYPYSDGAFYHGAQFQTDKYSGNDYLEPALPKRSWYELGAQAYYLDGLGTGTGLSIKGHFWSFIGPYLEGMFFYEGEDYLRAVRLGMQFALIQSTGFTLELYGQYQAWQGMLERQGGTFGVQLMSFPAKPVSLQIRSGAQFFPSFTVAEFDGRLGIMQGPWEFYGGWRWWNLLATNDQSIAVYQGPFFGVSRYY
jgi:hypothetical protein